MFVIVSVWFVCLFAAVVLLFVILVIVIISVVTIFVAMMSWFHDAVITCVVSVRVSV